MNALMEAKRLYAKLGLDFGRDLGFYLVNGVVISRPDRFIMAKPIVAAEGEVCWNPEKPDCWYVHCAVGRGCLDWFIRQAPIRLPLIAFNRLKDRRQALRVYNLGKFERYA